MTSTPLAEAADAPSIPVKRPPLLAAALVLAGMAGLAATLVLQASSPGDGYSQFGAASAWALVLLGLVGACWRWRRFQRHAIVREEVSAGLNRFHSLMSQTNRLILRRPDPAELLEGVCRLCIEAAHLDAAAVDLLRAGESQRAPAAIPSQRYVTTSPNLVIDEARLQTLVAALSPHAGRLVVVDDAATDARLAHARAWFAAIGVCSVATVPLRRGDRPIGALLLCSRHKFAFAGPAMPLLSELGADLSFALDNADREKERRSNLLAEHAREIAEDANRAKTEFLAQMSHELRTPLNAMLGFTQLLATDDVQTLSTTQAESVRLIAQAGWHLVGLLNDVMDISGIESRRFAVFNVRGDIASVLDDAVALTEPLARSHQVALSGRPASPSGVGAVADPRRLLQVLLNLLSNACKYNRPGGHVRVDVTCDDAEVVLDVVDDGVGMTHEHLSHLFEPFNRLGHEGRAIEGSGIGLHLTRHLVQMMNGRLDIVSHPASGTRARLVLPSCALPIKASTHDTPALPANPGEPGRAVVLYIEDDPVNRMLVEQFLLRCRGVRLLVAENGQDGIALARLRRPDLVLLDMHLPDMSGFDVLAALRSDPQTDTLQVVAVSADAVAADMAKAKRLGVVDYWTKPLDLQAFVAGISSLLGLRAGVDESTPSAPARGETADVALP